MRRTVLAVVLTIGLGCGHAPRPVPRQTYLISEAGEGVGGSGGHDCHQEQIQCFDRCWNSAPPYPHKKGDGWHYEYCTRICREAYVECVKAQEAEKKGSARRTLEFSTVDNALAWLREHKAEVALGTVVIVAGVAFVVATGGSGALLLVPLAL